MVGVLGLTPFRCHGLHLDVARDRHSGGRSPVKPQLLQESGVRVRRDHALNANKGRHVHAVGEYQHADLLLLGVRQERRPDDRAES